MCEIERKEEEIYKEEGFAKGRDFEGGRDGGAKAQDVHPALRHIRRQRL